MAGADGGAFVAIARRVAKRSGAGAGHATSRVGPARRRATPG